MSELSWPFLGSEALAAKAIPERAMRTMYEPVYPGVFVPWGIELTASQRARAAWLWSRRQAVVAGDSAAALLGAKWIDPRVPAELVSDNRRPPALIRVHSETLLDGEVTDVGGVPVTTAARTAFDIGRRAPRLRALQRLDALANATDVKSVDVEAVIAQHRGARGVKRLGGILPLVDGGAESPQETRTRLALIDAGFPIPSTQIPVVGPGGYLVARIDMGWKEWRVGVEYDGAHHWTDAAQRTRDIDRWSEVADCGWTIIRVGSDILRYRQGTLMYRVGAALTAAGWRP
jgi:AbiEi antitoxin C-terminal domain